MLGYLLLILILLLVDASHLERNKKLVFFGIFLTIFTGIRKGIGYDYLTYVSNIESESYNTELIPFVFQYVAHQTDPIFFFILSSVFIYSFYFAGIKRASTDYMGSIFFFIGFPFLYFSSLSTVRQSMALAVVFYLISLKDCSVKKKLLFLTIAVMSHYSAIIGLLLFIPWHKFSLKTLIIMFVSSFALGKSIFSIISNLDFNNILFLKFKWYIDNAKEFGGGSLTSLILYCITIIILIFSKHLISYDYRMKYYISLVCVGSSLYSLFSINPHVAERFGIFFWGTTILIIPTLVRILKFNRFIYYLLCISLFSMSIYIGHITSALDGRIESAYFPYRTIFNIT